MKTKTYTIGVIISAVLILASCNDNDQKQDDLGSKVALSDNYAIEVEMDNQVFRIQQEDLLTQKTTFTSDSILFLFREENNPFQLNLNFTQTGIQDNYSSKYIIPDANITKTTVDLNFFNADRDVSRLNKRIIFRKGIIEVHKLTENKLQVSFKGEGSGIMENDSNFPISGIINAYY